MDALTLRPVTTGDASFLRRVYASTRAQELAHVPWSDEQKAQFCEMQFVAQATDYEQNYPGAAWLIIEQGAMPIGRLYVYRTVDRINILDIALLPEHCGHGHGTHLLQELQEEARATGRPLSIYVEKFNPARRLYQRLGFHEQEDAGVYLRLEWTPNRVVA